MVRMLNLDEKFGLAVPMLDVGEPIKGRRPWERYLHLKGIRDDLVHVKDHGVDPDRAVRTAFDRLLLGDADTCAKDAVDIVQAARPGFLGAMSSAICCMSRGLITATQATRRRT